MKYDLEYFIEKFEAIPEDQWIEGTIGGREGKCCAIGHCGALTCNFTSKSHNDETRALLDITGLDSDNLAVITNVNDACLKYKTFGDTAKQRVVKYLK